MTRTPFGAAVIAAGLALAACGPTTTPPPPAHASASPTARTTASPTPRPLSAVAADAQGFAAWERSFVVLTGPIPPSSRPAAARELIVLGRTFAPPGVRRAVGSGHPLVETPAGCTATVWHVAGAFRAPALAPRLAGAGPIALVVRGAGACRTEAGGVVYMAVPADAAPATWVVLGGLVRLPRVPGVAGLPALVWRPMDLATCSTSWVSYAAAAFGTAADPTGRVPGCPAG